MALQKVKIEYADNTSKVIDFDSMAKIELPEIGVNLNSFQVLRSILVKEAKLKPIVKLHVPAEAPKSWLTEVKKELPQGMVLSLNNQLEYTLGSQRGDVEESINEIMPSAPKELKAEVITAIESIEAEYKRLNEIFKKFKPANAENPGKVWYHFHKAQMFKK